MNIVLCAIFFGACAAVLGNVAAANDRGHVINGIIVLSHNTASVFYWILSALSLGFVAISALMVVHRLTHHQRIALTRDAIILPTSRSSSEETAIRYDEITALSITEISGQRFLYVTRSDGTKFTITGSLLTTKEAFDELSELLQTRFEGVGRDAT